MMSIYNLMEIVKFSENYTKLCELLFFIQEKYDIVGFKYCSIGGWEIEIHYSR